MDEELKKRLEAQDQLLQKIYVSCEKTRKYLLWTFIVTIIFFALPLLGLLIAIPKFISTYSSLYSGFGL